MARTVLAAVAFVAALAFAHSALAFEWTPFAFPEGDQGYTLEVRSAGADGAEQVATLTIEIAEDGGRYTVSSSYAFVQSGLEASSLSDAALGGSMMGMFAFGPLMMFGPSFMMLPLLLGDEDIAVRAEPMRVMGMGELTMSESITVAGRECVLIRFHPDEGEPFEVAVAEGVPFPCLSRYDSGDGVLEIRLTDIR